MPFTGADAPRKSGGVFTAALRRYLALREAAAAAAVARHLSQRSDDHLVRMGLTEDQIRTLRTTGRWTPNLISNG
jgi:hypothetical protein